MAKLPALSHEDATIVAALRGLEQHEARTAKPRTYLGMSSIGHDCERRHWLTFRWSATVPIDSTSLLRIKDGFRCEEAVADYLRHAPGLTLLTIDPTTGKQFAFSDIGGHFRGHADGLAWGLVQAPTKTHVWECKIVGDAKFKAAAAAVAKFGEKFALAAWDGVYHAQGQLYMHYADAPRHWTTIGSPGARTLMGIRTERDRAVADRMIARARRVIEAPEPPHGISTDPAHYECRMCPAARVCHGVEVAPVNCRTCLHATPDTSGTSGRWTCAWHDGQEINEALQRTGCAEHRYIPALVPHAIAIDSSPESNWVEYEARDGRRFRNGAAVHGGLSSEQIRAGERGAPPAVDPAPLAPTGRGFWRPGAWG